jgi:hypothetical protein
LFAAENLPRFKVLIAGGSEKEAIWVRSLITVIPTLRSAFKTGLIDVWSRVEPSSLPELYSRCSVVCIPSLREQFGIVAIEAMMCGTPVVATRTGGLQHIIVQDFTGLLVDRLHPPAFASALSLFIRNGKNSQWMGNNAVHWTKDVFTIENVALKYQELYESLLSGENVCTEDTLMRGGMHLRLFNKQISGIEQLVGEELIDFKNVSSSPSPSFVIRTKAEKYFVKIFQLRPSSMTCLIQSSVEENSPPLYGERVRVAMKLSDASVCPSVVAGDETKGILIQEYLENMPLVSDMDAEQKLFAASSAIASICQPDETQLEYLLSAFHSVKICDPEHAIDTVDSAATKLFAVTLGGDYRIRKCHPQIELLRIKKILEGNSFLTPLDFRSRALGTIWFLLGQMDFVIAPPVLAHGSMKRVHLMRRPSDQTLVVCDLDHVGFYLGPYDIAHWVFYEYKGMENPAPEAMLKAIRRMAEGNEESYLGVAWLIYIILYRALWTFACGNWTSGSWNMHFLAAFPYAFRKVFTQ